MATRAIDVVIRAKDQYSKALNKAQKDFKKTGDGIGKSIQIGASVAIASIGAISVALIKMSTNVAKSADEIGKFSDRIGVSVEALSQYQHVAELSGVSFNSLQIALQRQTRRIAEAAQGTGEARKALQELGLTTESLMQLDAVEQFEAIAGAMNQVETQADRVRLAMRLWDTEGVKLLQITNQGTEAIKGMREEANKLGLTLSQEDTKAAADFNDQLARSKAAFEGLQRTIARFTLPTLTGFMKDMDQVIKIMMQPAQVFEILKIEGARSWNQMWIDIIKISTTSINAIIDLIPEAIRPVSFKFSDEEVTNLIKGYQSEVSVLEQQLDSALNKLLGLDKPIDIKPAQTQAEEQVTSLPDFSDIEQKQEESHLKRVSQTEREINALLRLAIAYEDTMRRSQTADKAMAVSAQSRSRITGAANAAMEKQMISLVETGKFSASEFAKVVIQQAKAELYAIAARSAVLALFHLAAAAGSYAFGNAASGSLHLKAAAQYGAISGASLAAAGALHAAGVESPGERAGAGISAGGGAGFGSGEDQGGGGQDGGQGNLIGETATNQRQGAQNITVNIHNPLSDENWADIWENQIIPTANAAGERDVKLDITAVRTA